MGSIGREQLLVVEANVGEALVGCRVGGVLGRPQILDRCIGYHILCRTRMVGRCPSRKLELVELLLEALAQLLQIVLHGADRLREK